MQAIIKELIGHWAILLAIGGAFLVVYITIKVKVPNIESKQTEFEKRIKEIEKICTMMGSTKFCKIPKPSGQGFKWPTLMELHTKLFDKGFEDAHDAMADITATVNCFYKLRELKIMN